MISKNLLDKLDKEEKEELKKKLEDLIERTFDIEKEYKSLNASYLSLQDVIYHIVESQPNAVWVLDKQNKIFLQNSESKKIEAIINEIDLSYENQEIEFEHKIYLVKINHFEQKKVITATDITEQKRSERLASMGQIAAHLAHEIRNPIGSIALLSSTLLKRIDIKQKPLLLEMQKALYRVEKIIKSTLLFTKGVQITRAWTSLDSLAQEIENAYENYSWSKDIDLHIDFTQCDIYADIDLLSLVMQNFLYNAIDAIEEDDKDTGKITFTQSKEEGYTVIIITDTGVPIVNKKILYEPFQTTKAKGHGLGLALSLEIIKAHDGKIELLEQQKGFKIFIKDKDL